MEQGWGPTERCCGRVGLSLEKTRGWKGPEGASLDVRSRALRLHTLSGFSSRRQGPEVSAAGAEWSLPACTSE